MVSKVKIKSANESPDAVVDKVIIKKPDNAVKIPDHLAAILALKSSRPVQIKEQQGRDAKSYFNKSDKLEPDPQRSLIGLHWDIKDRLVLEFDDGESLISEPVPVGSITNTSVVVAGGTGGDASSFVFNSFETISKNLDSSGAFYAYNIAGDLESITYANGIIKQLNYSSGELTSVVLSGNTPAGISLTKTFTYSGDNLIGANYS